MARIGTQQERIKRAQHAYIFPIHEGEIVRRYSVYLLLNMTQGLEVLWPLDSHLESKNPELLPNQIYSKMAQYPACHFRYDSAVSAIDALMECLRAINPDLPVSVLRGYTPSGN